MGQTDDRLIIPPEFEREFRTARSIGAGLDMILPLLSLIVLVFFTPRSSLIDPTAGETSVWLAYALVAFSVSTCLVARIVHSRLMEHLRRLVRLGHYRPGTLKYAYVVLYCLFMVPALWGFGYFVMTGGLITTFILFFLTPLCYLALTPHYSDWFRE